MAALANVKRDALQTGNEERQQTISKPNFKPLGERLRFPYTPLRDHDLDSEINAKSVDDQTLQLRNHFEEATLAFRTEIQTLRKEMASIVAQQPRAAGRGGGAWVDQRVVDKVAELEDLVAMLKVRVAELELQLQASLATTHNGVFLWRIPNVTQRRSDAKAKRISSIYSPPFYTSRFGYKLCVRAYLNGDGVGNETHLSMRGEYDALLPWPFRHKVSLVLLDQGHHKHIVQTFKPTPDLPSFMRPQSEMNVASGCPQFAPLQVLNDPRYVKDDVMFIKCIVDVSSVFVP